MIVHLAIIPRPFVVALRPCSTSSSASIHKTKTITCQANKPNFASAASRLQFHAEPCEKQAINGKMELGHTIYWKPRGPEKNVNVIDYDRFVGRLVEGGFVFQQNFIIRSSEIGPDSKAYIGALVSLLQESTLNHFKIAGIPTEGFGSTMEMSRRDLIWVICKMKIVVDSYPSWGDMIEMDTWTCASGKNGMRREWIVRDCKTGKTLLRALCEYMMMNKKTRRVSKFIEETREETKGFFRDIITEPIISDDDGGRKLRELDVDTANHVRTGLMPKWCDLDVNQHMNHVKYIDLILESVPQSMLETHKLSAMTLEYRKECGINSVLQSLSAVDHTTHKSDRIELEHTIRHENQSHILLKARSMWMPKPA